LFWLFRLLPLFQPLRPPPHPLPVEIGSDAAVQTRAPFASIVHCDGTVYEFCCGVGFRGNVRLTVTGEEGIRR
jgi:hypothetical protein